MGSRVRRARSDDPPHARRLDCLAARVAEVRFHARQRRDRSGRRTGMAIRKAQVARLVVFLILTAALHGAPADQQTSSALGQRRVNTWAARSSTGVTLGGTWTVVEHLKTGGVTGT